MSLFDALLLDPAPFHIWIANRTDLQRGTGTASDPFHGGMVGGVSQFDTIMNLTQVAQANVVVHLGPGTFVTKGFTDGVAGGWQIKTAMKILGSGIDVTVLQIDNSSVTAGKHVFAIAHALQSGTTVDAAEVADLSIDCNCGGAAASAFGAVRLLGNHARVRRVKVLKWGTLSTSVRAFGIACLTGDAGSSVFGVDNVGIEDCYALSPVTTLASAIATAFSVGGWDYALPAGREVEGKSPFIRNCYVDGGITTPSVSIGTGARTTVVALSLGWCRGGVAEGNQIYNVDVGGPYQTNKSIRDSVVRNNFMKNVAFGLLFDVGQLGVAMNSSAAQAVVASGVGTVSAGGINVTTAGLTAGDRVALDTGIPGTYLVTSVNTGANSFTIASSASPGTYSVTTVKRVLGVGRAIVDGNIIEMPTGSTNSIGIQIKDNQASAALPDYTNGDLIVRGNKLRLVDGVTPASGDNAYGLELQGAKNVQVANNVVDLKLNVLPTTPQPLQNSRCGNASYFNDLTSSGVLIQGYKSDAPTKKYDELATLTEDAFVLAFAED